MKGPIMVNHDRQYRLFYQAATLISLAIAAANVVSWIVAR